MTHTNLHLYKNMDNFSEVYIYQNARLKHIIEENLLSALKEKADLIISQVHQFILTT